MKDPLNDVYKSLLKAYFTVPQIINWVLTIVLIIFVIMGNEFATKLTIVLLALDAMLSHLARFVDKVVAQRSELIDEYVKKSMEHNKVNKMS